MLFSLLIFSCKKEKTTNERCDICCETEEECLELLQRKWYSLEFKVGGTREVLIFNSNGKYDRAFLETAGLDVKTDSISYKYNFIGNYITFFDSIGNKVNYLGTTSLSYSDTLFIKKLDTMFLRLEFKNKKITYSEDEN